MARKLIVEIVGDTSNLERSFKRSSAATAGFNRNMGQASRGAIAGSGAFRSLGRQVAFASAGFLSAAGAVSLLKTSVSVASNLSEQMSKSNVVFGDAAKAVEDWSKTSATAMGLAQDKAIEATAGFGALLKPLGILGPEAAKTSEGLVQLSSDLASFSNTNPADALEAVRSGLIGEAEPLRRYGILLSEARVQQVAMAQTGKTTAAALTNQEKVQARLTIIYRDSASAQGDFARTSGELANQQRQLAANVRNLQAALGKALIPDLLRAVQAMNEWLGKSENQERVANDLRQTLSTLKTVVSGIATVFKAFSGILGGNKRAIELLVGAFVVFKALSIAASVANVARSLSLIGTNAAGATGKVAILRGRLLALVANPYVATIAIVAIGAEIVAQKIKALQKMVEEAEGATFKKGAGVETTLVPNLAKQIDALRAAGKTSMEIIATLRQQLGGSLKADDLIGEAFAFSSGADPKLVARINKAVADAAKATAGAVTKAAPVIQKAVATGMDALTGTDRNALRLAAAELTESTADDLAALVEQRELLGRKIEAVRGRLEGATGKQAAKFADQLAKLIGDDSQALGRITSIQESAKADAESARDRIRQAAAAAAQAALEAADAVIAGLQFNFTKAQATVGFADDLATLDAWLAGIRARMAKEGQTLELRQDELGVLEQIKATKAQQRADITDALRLGLDKAELTVGFADDLASLDLINENILAEIQKTGTTVALQRDLFENQQAIKAKKTEQASAKQFKVLGLGPTGGEITPTQRKLQGQFATFEKAFKGTFLDDKEHRSVLDKIRTLLKSKLGSLTEDVRAAVRGLLDGLASELAAGDSKLADAVKKAGGRAADRTLGGTDFTGVNAAANAGAVQRLPAMSFPRGINPELASPRLKKLWASQDKLAAAARDAAAALAKVAKTGQETTFHVAPTRNLLRDAGLDPRSVKRASFALSGVGPGGTVAGHGAAAFGRPLATTVHTTVVLDGKKVATSTTRHQQTRARRNPPQKRGPNAP